VPRSAFEQDLLYSFGAFMTVCGMARNDAEARVRAMVKARWKARPAAASVPTTGQEGKPASNHQPLAIEEHFDVERSARDQITKLFSRDSFHGSWDGLRWTAPPFLLLDCSRTTVITPRA
jgi:restriction system protein